RDGDERFWDKRMPFRQRIEAAHKVGRLQNDKSRLKCLSKIAQHGAKLRLGHAFGDLARMTEAQFCPMLSYLAETFESRFVILQTPDFVSGFDALAERHPLVPEALITIS